MDIVLIAGLWLDASTWDDLAAELRALGHRPVPVSLPGQRRDTSSEADRSTAAGAESSESVSSGSVSTGSASSGPASATLADQVEAVLAAVDESSAPALVVGHSAAATLAWMAADARPEKVATAVLVGGFPATDGSTYADFFEPVGGQVAFPGWDFFEGPDSADLDEGGKARFAMEAIAVPEAVTRGVVHLTDERRYSVPILMVCPEYSVQDAKAWVQAGELPEVARAEQVDYVDIDSGHWPMLTRPAEFARILADAATR